MHFCAECACTPGTLVPQIKEDPGWMFRLIWNSSFQLVERHAAFPLTGTGSTRHFWSTFPLQDSATFRVPGRHSDRVLFDMTPPTAGKIKGEGEEQQRWQSKDDNAIHAYKGGNGGDGIFDEAVTTLVLRFHHMLVTASWLSNLKKRKLVTDLAQPGVNPGPTFCHGTIEPEIWENRD